MSRCLLLICWTLLAAPAWAHKASDAYLQLQPEDRMLSLRLDIALRDLDRELTLDADADGTLSWGELRRRSTDIQALVEQGLSLRLRDRQGAACQAGEFAPLQIDSHSDGHYAVLRRNWHCAAPPQDLALAYSLFAASDPTHRGIARLHGRTLVLAPNGEPRSLHLGKAPRLTSLFVDGMHHIWIGLDHQLFLLTLLLPAVLLRLSITWSPAPALRPVLTEILGVVTAFTVAHSLTLALAAFDVINPSSRWVESLIALSVLLAATNNLWPLVKKERWKLTFAFGLVHGFGFASALKDLGLEREALLAPLLSFNLGVEAGQLAIVSLFVPLAWGLRTWRCYPRWLLGGGSAAVALLAGVWLLERSLDLKITAL